jgi:hypothetical protein
MYDEIPLKICISPLAGGSMSVTPSELAAMEAAVDLLIEHLRECLLISRTLRLDVVSRYTETALLELGRAGANEARIRGNRVK